MHQRMIPPSDMTNVEDEESGVDQLDNSSIPLTLRPPLSQPLTTHNQIIEYSSTEEEKRLLDG